MDKVEATVITLMGLAVLVAGVWYIFWLTWRSWFELAESHPLEYSHRMLAAGLPVSVSLTANQILSWLRERMEKSGFQAQTKEPFEVFGGGLGLVFSHPTRRTVSILVDNRPTACAGGETAISIELINSRNEVVPFRYVVMNDPLHPDNGGVAARGRALLRRNAQLALIVEEVLELEDSAKINTPEMNMFEFNPPGIPPL